MKFIGKPFTQKKLLSYFKFLSKGSYGAGKMFGDKKKFSFISNSFLISYIEDLSLNQCQYKIYIKYHLDALSGNHIFITQTFDQNLSTHVIIPSLLMVGEYVVTNDG